MKKIIFLFLIFCSIASGFAQSRYISNSPYEEMDEIADLGGSGGVLILSKNGNLSINVTNAKNAKINPLGLRKDGYYVYTVVVDPKETPQPKIEINKRGDINRTNFVVSVRPNFYLAYLIDEVERPILIEDQTAPNDAYLDANGAEIEFSTSIEDLKVNVSPKLNVSIEKKAKPNDKEVFITYLRIPINEIEEARLKLENTQKEYDELNDKLINNSSGTKVSNKDWETLDRLEEKVENLAKEFKSLTTVEIFADGTNRLSIDINDLKPRMKRVYGVLLLNKVEKVYVTESSAAIAEGSRLYTMRDYQNAKTNFEKALNVSDMRVEDRAMILSNIAECDTCMKYEQRLKPVLLKLNEMRKEGGTQENVVRYANHAIGDFTTLNNYNPNEFYTDRIKRLKEIIADQPLDIHFTVSKWVNDYSGFYESGRIPNVEVWEFYGNTPPTPKHYSSDKAFKKLVNSSSEYRLAGITDNNGEIDVHISRNIEEMPTGFIFRAVKYEDSVTPQYLGIQDALKVSTDEYNKHQYRLKMYTKQ